jgi:hypothetical protein
MKPTVGRQVWLWGAPGTVLDPAQPFAASIVLVHSAAEVTGVVNLAYHDHVGVPMLASSVPLRMPKVGVPEGDYGTGHGVNDRHDPARVEVYATWMPYQVQSLIAAGAG